MIGFELIAAVMEAKGRKSEIDLTSVLADFNGSWIAEDDIQKLLSSQAEGWNHGLWRSSDHPTCSWWDEHTEYLNVEQSFNSCKQEYNKPTTDNEEEKVAPNISSIGLQDTISSPQQANSTFSMSSSIMSCEFIWGVLSRTIRKQQEINDGTYTQTGVGRKRHHNYTTDEIRDFVRQHLRESFMNIIMNSGRTDVAFTRTFRAIKTLPFDIHEELGLGNKYRSKDLNDRVIPYAESYVAFMFMTNKQDECSVLGLLEYSLLSFPPKRVRKLIEDIEEDYLRHNDFNGDTAQTNASRDTSVDFLGNSGAYENISTHLAQLKIDLETRTKNTIDEFGRRVRTSYVFKEIWKFSLEVMQDLDPAGQQEQNKLCHLIDSVKSNLI